MSTKFTKYLSKIFSGLLSCALILPGQYANANENAKKLLHDVYRARLEYPSNSYASHKLREAILLLEDFNASARDPKFDWLLGINVEMIFDNCPELQGGTLCNPTQCGCTVTQLPPYIIADFGKSLLGNVWRMKKIDKEIVMERIPATPPPTEKIQ